MKDNSNLETEFKYEPEINVRVLLANSLGNERNFPL
jgi:hypothetical protein